MLRCIARLAWRGVLSCPVVPGAVAPAGEKPARKKRMALVLSGGGSRGAYEAGVVSWLFENIYPKLGRDFEFDIVSGTSVGAIHAAYVAASSGLDPRERANAIVETWRNMRFDTVLRLSWRDMFGIPLRSAGFGRPKARGGADQSESIGGLVDIAPLEQLVRERIPWHRLRANLAAGRPSVLCTAVTEVNTGVVRVFLDGPGADTTPWLYDPHVDAVKTEMTDLHVRASAAIPFLFPSVRIGGSYYVDGGLRLNTPLSPAVRLQAEKVLVVGLKKRVSKQTRDPYCDADALTQPAFLLGKLLDVILLDPIENELHQLEIVNAMLAGGKATFGDDFIERIAPTLRAVRGVGYKPIEFFMQSPSEDIGRIAADCYHRSNGDLHSRGMIAAMIKLAATMGVPKDEADFLSYIYFDRVFTDRLLELGRDDAKASSDRILALLQDD
ncbi:MAG TPA: patatin-like phospholipase family protein [Candidatus Binatia bacterium]|jgi:NTE family protein